MAETSLNVVTQQGELQHRAFIVYFHRYFNVKSGVKFIFIIIIIIIIIIIVIIIIIIIIIIVVVIIFVCVLGVELGGGCGAVSIRFRPTLTFLPRHADILLEIMDKVASEMKS